MSIRHFLDEIEKGLKSSAYLLYADNPYLLEEAVSAIKRTLTEEEMDFNLAVFDFDSAEVAPEPEEIILTLNTFSFSGKRRHVIVKNLQRIQAKDSKKLLSYAANPSPDAVLIMLYSGTFKKDIRENVKGIKIIPLDIREQDLPSLIKEKAGQKGLAIRDEAVDYLIGVVGPDIGLLSSEVEKLALLGTKEIGIENIREIVEGSREYSVFDLTAALREKNSERVFGIFKILSETLEPYSLLGAINWQFNRMMSSQTPGICRSKKEGSTVVATPREDYYQKVFELLNEADIRIKSTGGAFPMEYLLVRLLRL